MARMLDLAFKLKQFAAGMPSEIKEVHNLHAGKVSIEWEEAIRKAYAVVEEPPASKPATALGPAILFEVDAMDGKSANEKRFAEIKRLVDAVAPEVKP